MVYIIINTILIIFLFVFMGLYIFIGIPLLWKALTEYEEFLIILDNKLIKLMEMENKKWIH